MLCTFQYLRIFVGVKGEQKLINHIITTNFKTSKKMEELVKKIEELSAAFLKDAKAQVTNGNKAAGQRARKNSLEIEKLTKEFRKVSIEAAKK